MKILASRVRVETAAAGLTRRRHPFQYGGDPDDAHAAFWRRGARDASRCHIELVEPVVKQAVREAGLSFGDLTGIARPRAGPDRPCWWARLCQALAYSLKIPLVAVNHLEATWAARIEHQVNYPTSAWWSRVPHSIYRCDSPSRMVQTPDPTMRPAKPSTRSPSF